MITISKIAPETWKKPLYIASKLRVDIDEEGNDIAIYDNPVAYEFNYQPVTSEADIQEFGENVEKVEKMVIPISYKDSFKEFDVAYLDGATPTGEVVNGANANYRLRSPRVGNNVIVIYMDKIIGK